MGCSCRGSRREEERGGELKMQPGHSHSGKSSADRGGQQRRTCNFFSSSHAESLYLFTFFPSFFFSFFIFLFKEGETLKAGKASDDGEAMGGGR